jgi:hypothetical protein
MEKISLAIEVGNIVRVALDPTVGHEKKKNAFA